MVSEDSEWVCSDDLDWKGGGVPQDNAEKFDLAC